MHQLNLPISVTPPTSLTLLFLTKADIERWELPLAHAGRGEATLIRSKVSQKNLAGQTCRWALEIQGTTQALERIQDKYNSKDPTLTPDNIKPGDRVRLIYVDSSSQSRYLHQHGTVSKQYADLLDSLTVHFPSGITHCSIKHLVLIYPHTPQYRYEQDVDKDGNEYAIQYCDTQLSPRWFRVGEEYCTRIALTTYPTHTNSGKFRGTSWVKVCQIDSTNLEFLRDRNLAAFPKNTIQYATQGTLEDAKLSLKNHG